MPMIQGRSYYYPGGQGTEVSGVGGGDASAYLQALMQRESMDVGRRRPEGMPQMSRGSTRGMAMPATQSMPVAPFRPKRRERTLADELGAINAMRQNDATWRGAATRPVGLGPQMIPGMAVDPNLLPQDMRPDSAMSGFAPRRSTPADEAWEALMLSRFNREYSGETGAEDPRRGHGMTTGVSRFAAPRR